MNDLSKPGASAFETLGVLDYNQNSNIHYDSDKKVNALFFFKLTNFINFKHILQVPTDGLVL